MTTDVDSEPIILSYDGERGEITRLSLRVALLTLISLWFYRFWATTRVRRYFWSRIKINGEALEYSGTGRELFISFLKAVAIIAAVAIPIRLAQAFYLASPQVIGLMGTAQSIALFVLYNFAIYYARRYRLTRTQWRGIRFNLTGSPRKFMSINLRYGALMGLTLGLTYPFWSVATQRYLISHSWFGDRPFTCQVRVGGLFLRWALAWVCFVGAAGVIVLMFDHELGQFLVAMSGPGKKPVPPAVLRAFGLFWGLFMLAVPVGVWYRLAEFRTIATGVGLSGVSFRVSLGFSRVLGLLGKTALAWTLLVVASVLVPIGIALMIRYLLGISGPTDNGADGIGALVAFLVLTIVGSSVISRAIVSHGLLNRLLAVTTVTGVIDLSSIGQTTAPVPLVGEGLLEAFDFGG